MTTTVPNWATWHPQLEKLINGEFASKSSRIMVEATPSLAFKKEAQALHRAAGATAMPEPDQEDSVDVQLQPYDPPTAASLEMARYLKTHLSNDLHTALLHGSLGTAEVVPYSDFDALIIIKDEVFSHTNRLARTAHRLFKARRFMQKQDPLQHHGWFVLPEAALKAWPEHYLPSNILPYASLLLESGDRTLSLTPWRAPERMRQLFDRLTHTLTRELANEKPVPNLYRYKSLLSQIMLLPTAYLQARDGTGVFKRESFAAAKVDFAPENWEGMETVSALRTAWPHGDEIKMPALGGRIGPLGTIVRRRLSPSVSPDLAEPFSPATRHSLLNLIAEMQARLTIHAKGQFDE